MTYKSGLDNPCYKELSDDEIKLLYKLRFIDCKNIKEILKVMKISQKKYYEYINKFKNR